MILDKFSARSNKIWFVFVLFVYIVLYKKQCVYCQEEEQQGSVILNLIYGIGIPWDVQGGYLSTGYVVRVPYAFPMKIKEWKSPFAKYFEKRKKRGSADQGEMFTKRKKKKKERAKSRRKSIPNHNSKIRKKKLHPNHYRWAFYYALETHAQRLGFEGRACVLRSICEAAEIPFDSAFGFIGEVMHLLFTPSSSTEPVSKHSDNEYHHAERIGKSGAPCERVFKECKKSLLNAFSMIHTENVSLNHSKVCASCKY